MTSSENEVLHPDDAYFLMLHDVLQRGIKTEDRTGVGTLSRFGLTYTVLADPLPIITTKYVNYEAVVAELLWFLSGERSIDKLQEYTSIWDDWANKDNEVPSPYGNFWRYMQASIYRFNKSDEPWDHGGYVDQIRYVVETLKRDPNSRRAHVTAWDPANATLSKLPPCHHSFTLNHKCGVLNMEVHQRSGDLGLGVPFNMASYATLLHLFAGELDMEVGLLKHNITDAHIYLSHVDALTEQMERDPVECNPQLSCPDTVFLSLDDETMGQFELSGYRHQPRIKMPIAV